MVIMYPKLWLHSVPPWFETKSSRGHCGVDIILYPTFLQFYKGSGSKPPIAISEDTTISRFTGLSLTIKVKPFIKMLSRKIRKIISSNL